MTIQLLDKLEEVEDEEIRIASWSTETTVHSTTQKDLDLLMKERALMPFRHRDWETKKYYEDENDEDNGDDEDEDDEHDKHDEHNESED